MKTKERLPKAWGITCLTVMICFLTAGVAEAQDAKTEPATSPSEGDNAGLNVTEAGTVELHVQGADLRRVLQLLSTQSKINIIATKEVQGTVTADLYSVTFTEALEAVLKSAGFWYVRKGNFITVMTPKQYADLEASQRQLAVRVFKLYYARASEAQTLVTTVLSENGTVSVTPDAEVGIATNDEDAGGNGLASEDILVVKDYPENLEQVALILKKLDVRPLQVLIEATILSASLDEDNALGVDFNALAGVDFRSLAGTSNVYSALTTGNATGAQMDKAMMGTRTNLNTGFDARSFKLGFGYNNIALFVQALEAVTDTTVLGNPKILIMNKQRGEVLVGSRDGYITTTFTETTASQTVEFLETGTKLVVRPFVGADGFIRMEIHPEVSDGGVSDDGLPFETTAECTTNVMVKDGHTIVIGGLFREDFTNTRTQVPLLGNIPGLGVLFRRVNEDTNRQEVIILITPHIIRHPADEATSMQLKDQVLRFRMGTRQGMMWFGRDRLAQSHMRKARQYLAAGDESKALWNVNMALSLESRMIEAIHLKERLTHEAIWARESRFSSINWVIQKMIMNELGRPVEEIAPHRRPLNGMTYSKPVRDAFGIGKWPKPKLLRIPSLPEGTEPVRVAPEPK